MYPCIGFSCLRLAKNSLQTSQQSSFTLAPVSLNLLHCNEKATAMDALAAMKQHYLSPLFQPATVVVIGASEREGSCGAEVFRNLMEAPFKGELYGVNLRHSQVFGRAVQRRLADVPASSIDLAIIATSLRTITGLMLECGERGVKSVLILSRDFVGVDAASRAVLAEAIAIAKRYGVRVLGPNMLGLFRPSRGLIAANYRGNVLRGPVALVSQSSSVASAMLDWAESHGVGFSAVVSLGAAADVNFGEVLDYLSQDHETHGILIYLEDVGEARSFMSALRVAGRTKPIAVMKTGRHPEEHLSRVARTHAERLIGRDDAFDAALRRVGVIRVDNTMQVSIAARMLAAEFRATGRRLAIVSNGYSAGRMAVDRARDLRVELPRLAPATVQQLDATLPPFGSHDNPVDVLGDAPPERFIAATRACLADPNIDGVLVILTPQVGTDHYATAQAMLALRGDTKKMLMTVWMGDKKIASSRELFDRERMACFHTPENAVEAFASLAAYTYNQKLSLQSPGPVASRSLPDIARARAIIAGALAAKRSVLNSLETIGVLEAFFIPCAVTRLVSTSAQAVAAAETMGLPVALKIEAENLVHKTEIDGVVLNLYTSDAVKLAAEALFQRASERLPKGSLQGLIVQKMHGKKNARELMAGVSRDKVFGPVVAFGAGGTTVEVFEDVAVALPPLNLPLVASLMRRTKVEKMLGQFRNLPAADRGALKDALLRVSEMACELPELQELDLNPLVLDEAGVIAVDATIVVAPLAAGFRRYQHMAIHPYPSHLIRDITLKDGSRCVIRPIRPEDADALQHFVQQDMSEESRFNRFLSPLKQLSPRLLARFTQLDYAREMALVISQTEGEQEHMRGVARYTVNPDATTCEFALAIADRCQGQGMGKQLMLALFAAAVDEGLRSIEGEVLQTNRPMLGLVKGLGFTVKPHPEDASLKWVVRGL